MEIVYPEELCEPSPRLWTFKLERGAFNEEVGKLSFLVAYRLEGSSVLGVSPTDRTLLEYFRLDGDMS